MEETIVQSELSETDKILKGVALIRKYQPNAGFAAAHNIIYFGGYDTSEQMTSEELKQMKECGWFEEYESWAINV